MSLVIGCYWSIGDVWRCDAFQIANQHPSAIAAFFSSVVWIKGHRHGSPRLRDLPNNEPPVCALASFLYTVQPKNYHQRLIVEDLWTYLLQASGPSVTSIWGAYYCLGLVSWPWVTSFIVVYNSCKLHSPGHFPWFMNGLTTTWMWLHPPGFVATDYGVQDVPLSLACHLKVDELNGWGAVSQLPEGCSLRLHTSKGTCFFARENFREWFSAPSMKMEDSLGKYNSRIVVDLGIFSPLP